MPFCLVPLESGRPIVLDKAIVFVGRDPECDVILTDSRKVSRKHCCLALVNNSVFIRDLDSMNGVWINGSRVQREAGLQLGDELAIGDVCYELQELRTEKKKRPEPPQDRSRQTLESEGPPPVRSAPRQKPSSDDLNLSMDIPIAIPDEGESFSAEPSDNASKDEADAADEDEEADKLIMLSDEF